MKVRRQPRKGTVEALSNRFEHDRAAVGYSHRFSEEEADI